MHSWIKYDLHMHSFASSRTKSGDKKRVKEMSAEDFVNEIIGKVDVFSVTDHNSFDNAFYIELYKYIEGKPIKLIKGSELDVYVDEENFFQMGIYFEDETDGLQIKKIIDDLYRNGAKPELGNIIQKMFSLKKRFLIMPEADKSKGIRSVWKKIADIGETDRFLFNGKQRIFSGYDSSDNFSITGASHWAMNYFKSTQYFEKITDGMDDEQKNELSGQVISKIKNDKFEITDSKANKIYNIIKEYGQAFTYFSFSDWHNKENYEKPKNNYVYGSLEHPFETLELAVLDPFSRIDVTTEDKKIPTHYIKNVSFTMQNKEYSIDFETGLNSIVGKRASGKSLLMSVIQKLSDAENDQLDKYINRESKKEPLISTESIRCTLMDGTVLKAGQLDSVGYINQNSIKDIFDNPNKASEEISSYFPELIDVNCDPLDRIIELLKLITPYNKNFKSFTTYLNMDKKFNNYAFDEMKKIELSKIKDSFASAKNSLKNIINGLTAIGFSTEKVDKIVSETQKIDEYYEMLIGMFNFILDKANQKIKILKDKFSITQMENELTRKSYASSKEIIFDNFNKLMNAKKVIYLIDKFEIKVPDVAISRKSKYLFASYYDVKEDLRDTLVSSIQDTLKSTKRENQEVIIDYLDGSGKLKAGNSNLWSKIDNKFILNNVASKKSFYMVSQEFDILKIKTMEDIYDKIKDGYLKDISNSSLGDKSSVYLELMLELEQRILLFDQPEDNVDNDYISNVFVPLLKSQKKSKQLIFVTHNPSVAVYTDSFNYIYASNDNDIEYKNYYIEKVSDKEKVLDILDGGSKSFSNRNRKYGNIIGEYK